MVQAYLYNPLAPMFGALLATLAKLAPAVDCIRVLSVSRGNRARVDTQEAMPPAKAAVKSILLVFFSLLRSKGGGPAQCSLKVAPSSQSILLKSEGIIEHPSSSSIIPQAKCRMTNFSEKEGEGQERKELRGGRGVGVMILVMTHQRGQQLLLQTRWRWGPCRKAWLLAGE